MRKTTVLAAGAWFLAACAGGERAPESQEEEAAGAVAISVPDSPSPPGEPATVSAAPAIGPGDTLVTGIVRETGALPLTQLVVQSDEVGSHPVAVRGSLKEEIQNLIGAEVRVWGAPTDNQPPVPPRAVEVAGYEILSVGGAVPTVGTIVEEGGVLFLQAGERLELGAPPEALRAHVGAKVWIVGSQDEDVLSVQSYGIIRN